MFDRSLPIWDLPRSLSPSRRYSTLAPLPSVAFSVSPAETRGSLAMSVTGFVPEDIRMEEQVSPADHPSEQRNLQHLVRPKVERQDCRKMEIVLGNGRRLLLRLTGTEDIRATTVPCPIICQRFSFEQTI